jgi:TetR/AcrR family transcriptional repressor of nem operon
MARPRQFDENDVLQAAGDAFWANGYEATSTRDLSRLMGLTPASLYNAFGDKQRLFQRALEHYLDGTLRAKIVRLESSLAPGPAITAFFAEIVDRSLGDTSRRGCMLVNSALEARPDLPELQEAVSNEFIQIQAFFSRCLTRAQATGDVKKTLPIDDAARQLLAVLLGLRVLARARPEPALLKGAVRQTLATLGLPPLPEKSRNRSSKEHS